MRAEALARGLAWVSAAVAVAAFFMPWARFSVAKPGIAQAVQGLGRVTLEVRGGGRTVTTSLADLTRLPQEVTGAGIPRLVRNQDAQAGLMVLELLTGRQQHAELKSLAVYLVPGLALAAALALTLGVPPAAIGPACALIAGIGASKLWAAQAASSMVKVTIEFGLWLSMAAYVGLAAAAALRSGRAKGAE